MADRFVLDTSAVFALTDREDGSELVEELLQGAAAGESQVGICAVSLMELYYISLREQGEEEATRLVALVKAWPVEWLHPVEKDLLLAGRFKAYHRLSFADALIAAVASSFNGALVHKDPEFESLGDAVRQLSLPPRG